MIKVRIKCEDGHELSKGDIITVEVHEDLMNRKDYPITFITSVYVSPIEGTNRIFLSYEDGLGMNLTNNHGTSVEHVTRWIHKGYMTKEEENRDERMKNIIDQINLINLINGIKK